MLPSIALQVLIPGGGTAAKAVSYTAFGLGAGGNALEQSLAEGADYDDALLYGTLSGAAEVGVELISGGIGGLGEGVAQKTLAKSQPVLYSTLKSNKLLNFATNIFGEGVEEVIGDSIDPLFKRITFDPDAPAATKEELLQSFTLGALASAVLQGGASVNTSVRVQQQYQDLVDTIKLQIDAADGKVGRYSDASKLAEMVRKKADKLGEMLGTEIDTKPMYLEEKIKQYDKLANKEGQKYFDASEKLKDSIAQDIKEIDETKRKDFINKNGLNYMFNEKGKIIDSYKNLTKKQKVNIRNNNKLLHTLDKNTNINYVYEEKLKQGFYDPDTNTININLNATDPYRVVGLHEFTHTLEGTKQYNKLANFILKKYYKQGKLTKELNRLERLYKEKFKKSNIAKALNEKLQQNKISKNDYFKQYKAEKIKYLQEELVANTISEKIFTDEKAINKLVDEESSLAKRIYEWIKEKISKKEPQYDEWRKTLNKAAKLYKNAIENKVVKVKTNETKASIKEDSNGKELSNNQKEHFKDTKAVDKQGNLQVVYHGSDAEFKSNQIKDINNINPSSNEDIRYSIKDTKDINSEYVKAKANMKEQYVFDKKDSNDIFDSVIQSLALTKNHKIEGGSKAVYNYLFQRMNESKTPKTEIARDVADHLIKYAHIDGERIPTDLRDDIQHSIETKLVETVFQDAKLGEYQAYKKRVKYVMNEFKERIKFLKDINKETKTIFKYIDKIKDFTNKTLPKTTQAEPLHIMFNEWTKLFKKINEKNLIKPETRQLFVDFKNNFYNEDNKNIKSYLREDVINMLNDMENINKINPNKSLSIDEIKYIKTIIKSFNTIIRNYNKVFVDGRMQSSTRIANKGIKNTQRLKQHKINFGRKFSDLLIKPETLIRYAEGSIKGEESVMQTYVLDPLKKGSTKEGQIIMELDEDFNKFFGEHKKYQRKLVDKKIKVGNEELPLGKAISAYLTSKRQQAREHFMPDMNKNASGFSFYDEKGNINEGNNISLTQEDVDNVVKQFDNEDLEYIEKVEKFFKDTKDLQQEVEFNYTGSSIIKDDSYYFPIITDKLLDIYKSYGSVRTIDKIDGVFNLYFTKEIIPHATNTIKLLSVDKIVENHKNLIAKFNSYYITVKNIQQIMNTHVGETTLKEVMEKKYPGFNDYLNKYIADIINIDSKVENNLLIKAINKLKSNFAVFALGANAGVTVNQLSIIPTSYAFLDASSISRGVTMKNTKSTRADMDYYCPYVAYRNYDSNILAGKINIGIDKFSKFQEKVMKPVSTFDRIAIGYTWNACQIEVEKKQGLKVGTEENMKAAGELLETVVRQTQGIDRFEQPALNRTNNVVVKTLLMFQTQNIQSISHLYGLTVERSLIKERMKSEPNNTEKFNQALKENSRDIRKAASGIAVSNLFYVMIHMLVKKLLGKDDKDKNDIKELSEDYVENTIGMIPILNNFYSKIFKGYDMKISFLDTFNDLIDNSKRVWKNITTGQGDPIANLHKLSNSLGAILGIPTKNITEYSMSIINLFNPDLAYKYRSLWYRKSVSEYTEDLEKALNKKDTKRANLIVKSIYNEKGIDLNNKDVANAISKIVSNKDFINIKNMLPKSSPRTITYDNQYFDLKPQQQLQFKEIYSKNVNDNLGKLVNSAKFANLDVQEKTLAIKHMQDYSYYQAMRKVLNVEPYTNKISAVSRAINPITVATTLAKCKKSLLGNKAAIQTYINSLSLHREQKYMLYGLAGYKPLNDNAYVLVSNYLVTRGYSVNEIQQILEMCKLI